MQAEFLIFQAKSFYNAYLNLERIDMQSGDFLFTVPMLVNGAFSIELSLKAILTRNSISYKKEHNLLVLFRMLPEEFQCEVIGYLIEKAPEYKDMEKFTKEFVLVSNAFVDCRYAFEGVVPSFDFRFRAALANASIRGLLAHYDVKLVPMEEKPMTDAELDKVMEDNRQQFIEKNISYIAKKEKGSLS